MLASFHPYATRELVTSTSCGLLLGSSPYTSSSTLFNTSVARPNCVDNTSPWEEGVRDLLSTTHNWDTIRHICRLPFQDRNTPQVILSDRWDPGLDSLLISFAAGAQYNEVLKWARDRKARELLRLLQPAVRRPAVWMWSWTPPNFASQDPHAIANNFHDTIYAAVHRVTFPEWVSYFHGHEEYAVTSLLCGVQNTREILHQRLTGLSHQDRNKFSEAEEELRSRHPLAHWILASSLQLSSTQPQDALNYLFRPILDLFASEDPACIVNRFAVLDIRFTLMADDEGDWSKLSTDFTFLEDITYGKPRELAESITDTESELFREFSVDDFLQNRERTRFKYGKQWSALSDNVFICLTANHSLVGRIVEVHLRLLRNQSSLTAVLDGIRRSEIPAVELSEISKLFRLIDSQKNYAFYRQESSKESEPVLPFLNPYFRASTTDPTSGLIEFFQFVPYFAWRQQRGKLVEEKGELSFLQEVLGIKGVWTTLYNAFTAVSDMLVGLYHRNRSGHRTQYPDIEQCLQDPMSSANSIQASSRIQLLRSTLAEIRKGQSKPLDLHKRPRIIRQPQLRRRQAYCCNCNKKRKYSCRDVCQCQHVRKGCDACLQGLTLTTQTLHPENITALDQSNQSSAEKIRATHALQSLLIRTSVSFSETHRIINQLSSEERRLLSCAWKEFPLKEFFYRFAVGGIGGEKDSIRRVGLLYDLGLTEEELCKLWNCLIKKVISKVKFLAADTWEAERHVAAEPISTLIVEEQGMNKDAAEAIKQLVIPLLSQDQMIPSFVTSWTQSLIPEHRWLLCAMFRVFPKPGELYGICFKRREPESHQWKSVQRQYYTYSGKAATLSEICLSLEAILGLVYWSRMLKDEVATSI